MYYKQPYLFYDLKKLIYATDRAMNEVELDNSVNIFIKLQMPCLFSRRTLQTGWTEPQI